MRTGAFQLSLVLFIFALLHGSFLNAAPISALPQTLRQPDGTLLHCFASGDEYYNWLHDRDGYTIIQHPVSGWYVYASVGEGGLVPLEAIPGRVNPRSLGLAPWLKSPASLDLARRFHSPSLKKGGDALMAPTKGVLNNVVIFIRFADEGEFSTPLQTYEDMFNTGSASMKTYLHLLSRRVLTVNSTFYPRPGATAVLSFKDSNPREYYMPQGPTAPSGYTDDRRMREHTLLRNAVESVARDIPVDLVVDADGNGTVDNVCFVISGNATGWSSLLWPHMWDLSTFDVRINGAKIGAYNFQLNDFLLGEKSSVLSHEMLHSLGLPDLYHYTDDGISPAATWDVMAENRNPPQFTSSYMRWRYGKWLDSIPEITSSGTYTIYPVNTESGNVCYKIRSPYSQQQYFVVEYRRRTGTFERSLTGEGLLVWRVSSSLDGRGNSGGPPDELYVLRPNGSASSNGTPQQAAFSANTGRDSVNDKTNPPAVLADGKKAGIDISLISAVGDSMTFTVTVIVPKAPNLPTALSSTPTAHNAIVVTWQDNSDDETGFEIQSRRSDENWHTIMTTPPDVQRFVVTGLFPEIQYFYRIRAMNGTLVTAWSDSSSAVTYPAPIPLQVRAIPLDERMVRVDWKNPVEEEAVTEVERLGTDGSWIQVERVINTNYILDRAGLSPGVTYCYRIRAVYGIVTSRYSDTVCARPGAMVLAAPTGLRAGRVTPSSVCLYWDFGLQGEDGFEVERSEMGGQYRRLDPQPGSGIHVYVDRTVSPEELYSYRVRAIKNTQRSPWTPALKIAVPALQPGQWVQTRGPEGGHIVAIVGAGADLFAGSKGRGLIRSTDNGYTWFDLFGEPDAPNISALAGNEDVLFAGSLTKGLFRTTNRGESWTSMDLNGAGLAVLSVYCADRMVLAGCQAGLVRSTDGGDTWTVLTPGFASPVTCFFRSGSMLLAGTSNQGVFRSLDEGLTWEPSWDAAPVLDIRSFAQNGPTILAATDHGVYRTLDNGGSWLRVASGMGSSAVTSLAMSNGIVYAGTESNGLFSSSNNGDLWNRELLDQSDVNVRSLFARDTTLLAGFHGGGVSKKTFMTGTWTASSTGLRAATVSALTMIGTDMIAGLNGGGIHRSWSQGDDWKPINQGLVSANISSLVTKGNTLFALPWGRGVYRSTNRGQLWTRMNEGLMDTTVTALATSGSSLLAATQRSGILRSDNEAVSWQPSSTGLTDTTITSFLVNGTLLLAAGPSGVYRGADEGRSWTGPLPGSPSDVTILAQAGSGILAWSSTKGLQTSVDNGGTWTALGNGLPTDPVTALLPVSRFVFASTDGSGVLISEDGGWNWTSINMGLENQGIHSLLCEWPYLYAGTMGGSVWRLYLPDVITGMDSPTSGLADFLLEQNYPNPFNPATHLVYSLSRPAHVQLTVLNALGRPVAVLVDEKQLAGRHASTFYAGTLPSGVYHAVLHVEGTRKTVSMILVK